MVKERLYLKCLVFNRSIVSSRLGIDFLRGLDVCNSSQNIERLYDELFAFAATASRSLYCMYALISSAFVPAES